MDKPISFKFCIGAGICKVHRDQAIKKARQDEPEWKSWWAKSARDWNKLMVLNLQLARSRHEYEVSNGTH